MRDNEAKISYKFLKTIGFSFTRPTLPRGVPDYRCTDHLQEYNLSYRSWQIRYRLLNSLLSLRQFIQFETLGFPIFCKLLY